jgi:hypothetical protein
MEFFFFFFVMSVEEKHLMVRVRYNEVWKSVSLCKMVMHFWGSR